MRKTDSPPVDTPAMTADSRSHNLPLQRTGTMRAVVQERYGSPDVLHLASVPVPAVGPGQIRVRVAAASVNARDWHIMRGEPRVARLLDPSVFGRKAPRVPIRGTDVAGTVDAVGEGVDAWHPGDPVFGESDGTFAEYAVADPDALAAIPSGLSFQQAAAMPLAATTALACLRAGRPSTTGRVLINGASGGVGTFTVQLAKAVGFHVTAVCSARNAELARSLGADVTVDYHRQDFCATKRRFDLVIDLVGNRSIRDLRALVRPGGTLVLSGGGVPGTGRLVGPLGLLVRAQLMARLPGPRIAVPRATPSTDGLAELATLVASGRIAPVIDRTYPLSAAADAIRYLEREHARAKVLVTVPQRSHDNHEGASHD